MPAVLKRVISLHDKDAFREGDARGVVTANRVQIGGLRRVTTVEGDLIEPGPSPGVPFSGDIAGLGEAW